MTTSIRSNFTPSMMKPDVLETLFVQQEPLATNIIAEVRANVSGAVIKPMLITGPRGIGKTHLVSVVFHRLHQDEGLKGKILLAWTREEEWGVTSFLDVLLRILRALLVQYPATTLAEELESLYEQSPRNAEATALKLLNDFVGEKRLLLFIENFDHIYGILKPSDRVRLRKHLFGNSRWMIIATAQGLPYVKAARDSSLETLFKIVPLKDLSLEDATLLLKKAATLDGDIELAAFLGTPDGQARLRAVHRLAGGNHRVYMILSQFLTKRSLDELVGPLMKTLDDLTPYYQSRMADLSPQQRKIVEFMCDRRGASPVWEISKRCFMTQQTASGQLKLLRDEGYVRSSSFGRESYYELREPVMRLCVEVKTNRAEPIRLLVDFLRLWYSRRELRTRLRSLHSDAVVEREYVVRALETNRDVSRDPKIMELVKQHEDAVEAGNFDAALKAADELVAIRGVAGDYGRQAHALLHVERWGEALASADRSIDLKPSNNSVWLTRWTALQQLGRYEEALVAIDKGLKVRKIGGMDQVSRALTLSRLGREMEAREGLRRAAEMEPMNPELHAYMAMVFGQLGRTDEALGALSRAIELDGLNVRRWVDYGLALEYAGRSEEAIEALSKASDVDPSYEPSWHNLGQVLGRHDRYLEALKSFDRAISLDATCVKAPIDRAETLLVLQRWDEGAAALEQAVKAQGAGVEQYVSNTQFVVRALASSAAKGEEWKSYVGFLLKLYDRTGLLRSLGQSLVEEIREIVKLGFDGERLREWVTAWQRSGEELKEMMLPLRLLDAAARFCETQDSRVLLSLPVEERAILNAVLRQPGDGHVTAGLKSQSLDAAPSDTSDDSDT